jgi:hypothetical protein
MRVRVNSYYVFNAAGFDIFDPKTDLENGEIVKVINL